LRSAAKQLWSGLPGMAPTFLIVGLLAAVLVPLPTVVVDLLLSLSLAGAVLLLVGSLKVERTSDFLGFPQLLLLVTLFRLALNVSTTRLILSEANAGQVIDAFAGFVVREDLIVGAVMFLIITVIQYIVIARGAERVAEVSARFALDALPGHQAAIDADLKAGVISAREAARRRAELNERSNFHGAMDGAIKYVRGDAMAGLAITTINLAGGLAVGIGRMGYTWQESFEVYGRLTIGDGLLAQIPALLVSLAAGVLVSRVDREREEPPANWLKPAMLVVPSFMLMGLALVPGMPWLAFATTGVGLLAVAVGLAARRPVAVVAPARPGITVTVSSRDFPDAPDAASSIVGLRSRCAIALGIDPPPFELRRQGLDSGALEVRIGDRLLTRTLVDDEADSGSDAVLLAAFRAIMDHAEALVDLQDLDAWVERVRERRPAVVSSAMAVVEPIDLLAMVRALLRERIALPPLEALLGVLADGRVFRQTSARPRWPEHVRERLAGYWVRDLLDAAQEIAPPAWVRLDRDAEESLLARAQAGEEGPALALSDKERARWLDALVGQADGKPRLVLANPDVRPLLAQMVHGVHPFVPVIATVELERAGIDKPRGDALRWVQEPA
jgi:flagellar biosynthesis component FlhA